MKGVMNGIESGRPIRIGIESGSFAGPYQKATYAACEPVFLAVTDIGDVKAKNGPKFDVFRTFGPFFGIPWPKCSCSRPIQQSSC